MILFILLLHAGVYAGFFRGGYMPCLVLDNLQYNSYVQDDNNKRIIIISEATNGME